MNKISVFGVPDGYEALLLLQRQQESGLPLIHIAQDEVRMTGLAGLLKFFNPKADVLLFPPWDCLPYDRVSPQTSLLAERAAVLAKLAEDPEAPRIILTTAAAFSQRCPPASVFLNTAASVKKGGKINSDLFLQALEQNGYSRVTTVLEASEYAVRGGIIDFFPAGAAYPVRLDFFGSEIDSLRYFDPQTQLSLEDASEISLFPVSELRPDPKTISLFRSRFREYFGAEAASDQLYVNLSEGRHYPGAEHYLSLFYETTSPLTDYLPSAEIFIDYRAKDATESFWETVTDHFNVRQMPGKPGDAPYRALPPKALYLSPEEQEEILSARTVLTFSPFSQPPVAETPGAAIDFGAVAAPSFKNTLSYQEKTKETLSQNPFDKFLESTEAWQAQKKNVILAASGQGAAERLKKLFREHGAELEEISFFPLEELANFTGRAAVKIAVLPIEHGFIGKELALVTEQDLLGERLIRQAKRRRQADQFLAEAAVPEEGDLVVHQEHGIGRYAGLQVINVNNAPHDCLCLLYEGGDKLFLPVENIDMISRFGSGHENTPLDKLGSAAWQARKSQAKGRIKIMAEELLKVAAARLLKEAPVLSTGTGLYEEFCAGFPYAETEDQARAIEETITDLASGRPMDRLICGDVGFGKTEIAMRAAFIVAMNGAQVAVVVPTTLLARQHYRNFSERFKGLPIRIAQLSRLVSAKEATKVREELKSGQLNIIIGTHALLAKAVEFADLGLLIVDEEQHFGVGHKEKLKKLKADVHVLTLSATPIPRTLQLALSGVREMSLITTPPVDRLAVRTFIMPFDDMVIREAVLRERFRGGQIFAVAPRVQHLEGFAEELRRLTPDSRLVTAHGQMPTSELEQVMLDFSEGKYDILLATNIIESGIDMPRVNTLIIQHAEMFGLSQLYQLRGRIGRGKLRGYAYLTYPQGKILSAASEKRLNILQSLDTLGAGFTLASHDLDLRGAGNLLGDEQSGQIRDVGVELYQQMLEDTVEALKTERGEGSAAEDTEWVPNISLGLPVLIPESYVQELPVRLGLYRKIGQLSTPEQLEAMAVELTDRFGSLPPEAENLLTVVGLKYLCRQALVEKIDGGPKGMVFTFRKNRFMNPIGLAEWISRQSGSLRLRPDHKLVITREMTGEVAVKTAKTVLQSLIKLASAVVAEGKGVA